jgi:hypothetical protein
LVPMHQASVKKPNKTGRAIVSWHHAARWSTP